MRRCSSIVHKAHHARALAHDTPCRQAARRHRQANRQSAVLRLGTARAARRVRSSPRLPPPRLPLAPPSIAPRRQPMPPFAHVRRRIEPRRPPRVAPANARAAEPEAPPRPVDLDRIERIFRACRQMPAFPAGQRLQGPTVDMDRRLHRSPRPCCEPAAHWISQIRISRIPAIRACTHVRSCCQAGSLAFVSA